MRDLKPMKSRLTGLPALALAAAALLALAGMAMAQDRRGDDNGHGRHGSHHGVRELHDAGTVSSFDTTTGRLTIALSDGGSVSGLVTTQTQIECEGADDNVAQRRDHGGDDNGGQGTEPGGDHGGQGSEPGDDNGGEAPMPPPAAPAPANCGTGSLAPGVFVGEAELRVDGGSAVFREIELGHHS